MTALAADVQRKSKGPIGSIIRMAVNATSVIFAGALVCREAATNLIVPASDTSGLIVVGVALEGLDNSAGADGSVDETGFERAVRVEEGALREFVTDGTPKYGDIAYVVDDNTVSPSDPGNSVIAGRYHRQGADATHWFIRTAVLTS